MDDLEGLKSCGTCVDCDLPGSAPTCEDCTKASGYSNWRRRLHVVQAEPVRDPDGHSVRDAPDRKRTCDTCGASDTDCGKKSCFDSSLWCPKDLAPQPDPVNHPAHYTSDPSGVECIQITRHRNFNIGNAIKYLWRAGLKGDRTQDLKKALFYIQDETERLAKCSS